MTPDDRADEGIARMIAKWREEAEGLPDHEDFHDGQDTALRGCADELETFWRGVRDGRLKTEYQKHSADCAGWQANCLDLRLCNCAARDGRREEPANGV